VGRWELDLLSCYPSATHVHGEGLVLALVVVAELVGGLSVRDLVVPEPREDLLDLAGEVPGQGRGEREEERRR
jgi:hypothetical protein